jgi:hypothetical protein
MLHEICMSRTGNENIHQCLNFFFGDDNIHLSPCMVGEKVRNLSLNVNSTLWCNSCNNILKVSWVVVRSFLHEQCNKWIPKSSMVWPHWHCERCGIIGCGIPKQIQNVVRKWAEDKRNKRVLGQANNQALTTGHAHKCAHTTFERAFAKKEVNSCLCNWPKDDYIWR